MDALTMGDIRLRYPDIEVNPALRAALRDPATRVRAGTSALGRLGIDARADETPQTAWLRAMAEENDLPVTVPADRRLTEAIVRDETATRFLWALA